MKVYIWHDGFLTGDDYIRTHKSVCSLDEFKIIFSDTHNYAIVSGTPEALRSFELIYQAQCRIAGVPYVNAYVGE